MSSPLDYEFPVVTKIDFAFPTMGAPPELVKMAHDAGFRCTANTPANDLFSVWFSGGLAKMPTFKTDVDLDKARRAMNWAACFMRSFAPKHEDKEAVCALIFDAALDLSNIEELKKPRVPR